MAFSATPLERRRRLEAAPGVPPEVLKGIGQMMGVPYDVDQWDGRRVDRRELLDHIAGNLADGQPATGKINNVVFLTGDIHSSWACAAPRDAGNYPLLSQSVAVEFVGVENGFKATNRHVKLLEFDSHGYSVVDVSAERVQMDWFFLAERTDPNSAQRCATAWLTRDGANSVQPAAGPLGS